MGMFAIPRFFSSRSSASSQHPDFYSLQIHSHGTWLPTFTSHLRVEYTIIPFVNKNPLPLSLLHLFLCPFAIPRLSFRLHTTEGVCLLELVQEPGSSSISAYLNRQDDCCSEPRFRFSCIEELLHLSASLNNSSTNPPQPQEHPSIISLSDNSSSSTPCSSGSDFSSLSDSSDASFDYTTLANTRDPLVSLDIIDDSLSLSIFDANQVAKAVLVLDLHVPIFRDFLSLEKYVPLSFLPSNFDISLSFLSPNSSPQCDMQLSMNQVNSGNPKSTQTRLKLIEKRKREVISEDGKKTISWPSFLMSDLTFKHGPQLRLYEKYVSVWRPQSSLCTLTADIQTIPLNQEASLFEISCKLTFACESLKSIKFFPSSSSSQMSSSSPNTKLKPRFFMLVSESFISQDLSKLGPLRLIGTDPPDSTNVDLQGFRICEFEAGFPFSSCSCSFVFQQVIESGAKAYVPMFLSPLPSFCSLKIERPPFPCEVVVPHAAITDSWIPNNTNQLNVLSYQRKSSNPCVRPFEFQVSKLPSFSSPKFPWPKEYTWISSSTLSIQPSDGGMDVLLSMNLVSSLKPGKELIRIVQPKYSSLSWGMVNGHPKTEHRMVLFESGEVVVFQGNYPTSSIDICWSIKSVYEKCSNFTSIKLSIPTPNVPSLVPTTVHIQSTSYSLAGYIDPNSKRTILKHPVSVTQLAWNNQTVSDLILYYEIEDQSHDETNVLINNYENVVLPVPSTWQVFCSYSQFLLLILSCLGILLLLVYQVTLPLEPVTDQASFLTTPLPKNFEKHEDLKSLQIKLLQVQAVNQKLQEQYRTVTKEVYKTVSVTSCTNTEYITSPTRLSSLELEKQQFQNAFGFLRFNKKNDATN